MLLDAYYKVRFYTLALTRSIRPGGGTTQSGNVAIPTLRLCDGSYQSTINAGQTSKYYGSDRAPYARPVEQILGQAESYSIPSSFYHPASNIIVGSGTTPVTVQDHCIEQEITENLICQSVTHDMNMEEGTITFYKTMTNTSDETVTVTEVGLAEMVCLSNYSYKQVLVMREILKEPMVVGPGESFTVRITHRLPISA